MDGVLAALESRNDVLRRRLQQSDQFCNKFVLGLDSAEELEVLLAYVNSLFYVCSFEFRLSLSGLVAFGKLLDEFSGSVSGVAEHECGVALESAEDLSLHAFFLERFLEEGILSYQEFDVLFEARAAEFACFRSVQALDIHEVEVRVLSELSAQGFNDEIFIFLFHTCL